MGTCTATQRRPPHHQHLPAQLGGRDPTVVLFIMLSLLPTPPVPPCCHDHISQLITHQLWSEHTYVRASGGTAYLGDGSRCFRMTMRGAADDQEKRHRQPEEEETTETAAAAHHHYSLDGIY